MDYRIENDGDAIERRWGGVVGTVFHNYELLWREHVVPITWRVVNRHCLYVRSGAPSALRKLATCNYGTFIHLAAAHEQLEIANAEGTGTGAELFARTGLYTFYSRLFSAREVIKGFLDAVKDVVFKYERKDLNGIQKRLVGHPSGNLYCRYETAFKTRTGDYRNPQVHHWGLPAVGSLIPKREYLHRWVDETGKAKDLGQLDRFQREKDFAARLQCEFVDAIKQAKGDLVFAETVVNDIWQVALDELGSIVSGKGGDRYRKDQTKGLEVGIPKLCAERVSSESAATSGFVVVKKE